MVNSRKVESPVLRVERKMKGRASASPLLFTLNSQPSTLNFFSE
jgi:hypothetical protein